MDVLAGTAERIPAGPREAAQDGLLERGLGFAVHGPVGPVQHVDEVALDLDASCAVAVPEAKLR